MTLMWSFTKYLGARGVDSVSPIQGESQKEVISARNLPVQDRLVNVLGALDRPDAPLGTAEARERLVHVPLGRKVRKREDLAGAKTDRSAGWC